MSGSQIQNYLPSVNLLRYEDLLHYDKIPLGKDGLVILYPVSSNNSGHWVCLFLKNNILHFFDSYGCALGDRPDYEQKFMSKNYIKNGYTPKMAHYLTCLLDKSPYPVSYNKYDYQSLKSNVETCGYWCVARLKLQNLSSDQFHDLFKPPNSDMLVIQYINSL